MYVCVCNSGWVHSACHVFLRQGFSTRPVLCKMKTGPSALLHTVESLLAQNKDTVRDIDVVELFAGVGSIVLAARSKGLCAQGFDKDDNGGAVHLDICTPYGLERAARSVSRIKEGGLLCAAPECSSFTFPNSSGHARKAENNFEGDETKHYVVTGSLIAWATAYVARVALERNVCVVLEDPPSSCIFKFAPIVDLINEYFFVHSALVAHCAYDDDRPVGSRFKKLFKFVSPSPFIEKIARPCQCGTESSHVPLMTQFVQGDTGNAKRVGEVRTTGNPQALKASQCYPRSLGIALIEAWMQPPEPVVPSVLPEAPREALKRPAAEKPDFPQKVLKRPAAALQEVPCQVLRRPAAASQQAWHQPGESDDNASSENGGAQELAADLPQARAAWCALSEGSSPSPDSANSGYDDIDAFHVPQPSAWDDD